MGKIANRRSVLLGLTFSLVAAVLAALLYTQFSEGRNLRAVLGPRIGLLDLSSLERDSLQRLSLADLKDAQLRRLGIRNLKDRRLSSIHLYDLRDQFWKQISLDELREPALSRLTIADLRETNWLNTPPPLAIPDNKIASTKPSAQQAQPKGPTTLAPAVVAVAPARKEHTSARVISGVSRLGEGVRTAFPEVEHHVAVATPKPAEGPVAAIPSRPVQRRVAVARAKPAPRRSAIAAKPAPRRYIAHRVYPAPRRQIAVERYKAFTPSTAYIPRAPEYRTIYGPQPAPDFERHRVRTYSRIFNEAKRSKLRRLPSIIFRAFRDELDDGD